MIPEWKPTDTTLSEHTIADIISAYDEMTEQVR